GGELLCDTKSVSPILTIGKEITDVIHGGLSDVAALALLCLLVEGCKGSGDGEFRSDGADDQI
ncbi:MAG: hypothetical protein RLZ25_1366, partial [Pseudomonadota bacterium]